MTLARDLQQVRASLEAQLSTPVLAALERTRESRRTAASLLRALDVGDTAPDFELRSSGGRLLRSSELLARGALVLSFSRGSWCPYSATELQYLEQYAPQVRDIGANVLAISPDDEHDSSAAAQALQLSFPVASDVDNVTAGRFGLPIEPDDPLRRVLTGAAKRATTEAKALPTPGLFVLDSRGVVRFAFVSTDAHLRAEPDVWLGALRRI